MAASGGDWADIAATYDTVAEDYAAAFYDELAGKPFDRDLLDRLAALLAGPAPVCDLGCGPGHLTGYLADRGCRAFGVDLSAAMLRAARRRRPGLCFQAGDLRRLPFGGGSLAAVVCFYAVIHLQRHEVPPVLAEMHRVLRPGGVLLLAVHGGTGRAHTADWFGRAVAVDATLFTLPELSALLRGAGFAIARAIRRPPYPFEHPTPRLYLWASRG